MCFPFPFTRINLESNLFNKCVSHFLLRESTWSLTYSISVFPISFYENQLGFSPIQIVCLSFPFTRINLESNLFNKCVSHFLLRESTWSLTYLISVFPISFYENQLGFSPIQIVCFPFPFTRINLESDLFNKCVSHFLLRESTWILPHSNSVLSISFYENQPGFSPIQLVCFPFPIMRINLDSPHSMSVFPISCFENQLGFLHLYWRESLWEWILGRSSKF